MTVTYILYIASEHDYMPKVADMPMQAISRPYSMAVAPLSWRRIFRSKFFMVISKIAAP